METLNISNKITLTKDQEEGVKFALDREGSILAFGVGSGKTAASITVALHILKENENAHCLIVCPKTATTAFKKELENNFNESYSIYTVDYNKQVESSRIHIFNISKIEPLEELVEKLENENKDLFLIVDEVHSLESSKNKSYKILNSLRPSFFKVLGLTATPLLNNPHGLWFLSNFILPNSLGSFSHYTSNHVVYEERVVQIRGGLQNIRIPVSIKNTEKLKELLDEFVLTRKISYNVKINYYCTEFNESESEYYSQASKGIFNKTEEDDDEKEYSARLHDLQRVANGSHIEFTLDEEKAPSKIKLLLSLIYKLNHDNSEGVIIYTEYLDAVKMLEEYIKAFKEEINYNNLFILDGSTKQKKRVIIEEDLKPRDILIITKAGSQSINLPQVNNIIFYDTPFAIQTLIQTIGRITRLNSPYNEQKVHILEVIGTIDSYKRYCIEQHANVVQAVFGRDNTLPDVEALDAELARDLKRQFKNKFLWLRENY